VYEVQQTKVFSDWLDALADLRAADRILQRIFRLQAGLIGDAKPIGDGVSELRIDYGPGYRLYFVQRGPVLIILLCGGTKGSQKKDMQRAREMKASL